MSSAADIDIAVAVADEAATIANLMQLYIHDFSELWSGEARGELEVDGRFAPYPHLEDYWRDADRIPLLFRQAGRPVGFALLNRLSPSGRPVDHNMAEFFIVRKHRRSGLGRAAAHRIFSRFPGIWEVAVARRNAAALPFWGGVIRLARAAKPVECLTSVPPHWDGPVFRFSA